jgi:long-subunit fatty acid transport protein
MIKFANKALFSAMLYACSFGAQAQNITKSPYSIIGLGELVYTGNAQTYSLGQANQGYRSPFSVNYLNPASYSAFLTTNIEAGATYSSAVISGATNSSEVSNSWISNINFGIPLSTKRGIGFSFGAAPYTSVGYNIKSDVIIPQDPQDTFSILAQNNFIGRGGLTKFYLGYGMRLHRMVSVGVNANYVYGEVNNSTQLLIPAKYNMFNTNEDNSYFVKGWLMEFGTQVHDSFSVMKKNDRIEYDWIVGATITPQSNFSGEQTYLLRNLPIGSGTGIKDTIFKEEVASGNVLSPMAWKFGVSFARKDKWSVLADIKGTNWSDFVALGRKDSLRNSLSYHLGFSYIPDYKNKNILGRIEYRIGGRYERSNLEVFGTGVDVRAFTLGMGIPMGRNRSRLNLGAEWMQRGTTSNGLIQEDYFKVFIGITFADKWFYRYRYD